MDAERLVCFFIHAGEDDRIVCVAAAQLFKLLERLGGVGVAGGAGVSISAG